VTFEAIAEMWQIYLYASNRQRHDTPNPYFKIDAVDVAQMMSLLKKMRWLFGDGNDDNFVDDLGYVAIAAQLAEPQKPIDEDADTVMKYAAQII
jgi:hypothetical protein